MQIIYTFSVKSKDVEAEKFVEKLKKECARTGRSFSWMVLQALKEKYGKL